MKIIINENQKGLLFKNGKFIDVLNVGKHRFYGRSCEVIVCETSEEFKPKNCNINSLLTNIKLADQLTIMDVGDESVALHFEDNKFISCLTAGKYAFWNNFSTHTFQEISIKTTQVSDDVPKYIFTSISKSLYFKVEVLSYQKARISFDGKLQKLLNEGTYYFWNNGVKIDVGFVDTRLLQMDITGQEILTLDKVALRINFVCHYKITDFVKIHTEIEDFKEQMHVIMQLALREYIGKYRLDEILENKDKISEIVLQKLKERENDFFIKISDAGVKDIILPGEIREIMNMVLIAEKKAQANVISRREEVASTRSLLNTAKLMEENVTLYKLKELEYLEKICENVGSISVGAGADLLSQLSKIVKG